MVRKLIVAAGVAAFLAQVSHSASPLLASSGDQAHAVEAGAAGSRPVRRGLKPLPNTLTLPVAWTTLAGAPQGNEDGPPDQARFALGPSGIAVDAAGLVYVADSLNALIRKVAPDGSVTTLAGSGVPGWFSNGSAREARFSFPVGVALGRSGELYVADQYNNRIRRVAPDGTVSTFAGGDGAGFVDGAALEARFNNPFGLAIDAAGIYVTDQGNHRVRKIAPDGSVSTLAGSGTAGYLDGPATVARFNNPWGVAVDAAGNVFVVDNGNHRVRKVAPDGTVSTLAGSGTPGFEDGPGATARFGSPAGAAVDAAGVLYVADMWSARIRRVGVGGVVSTVAGDGQTGYLDAPAPNARFAFPTSLAVDGAGNIYVGEMLNNRIRMISASGVVTTFAGTGPVPTGGWVDGPSTEARFESPIGIAVDLVGNAYVSDYWGQRIRRIDAAGNVTTFAGGSGQGCSDGPGDTATFSCPSGLALSATGTLYLADQGNHRIRAVAPDGAVSTLAGDGTAGYLDGPAAAARFAAPAGVAVDALGNVLVADRDNHRIRKVAPDGTVTTVAGSGTPGFADGAVAMAQFNAPSGVAVDAAGTIWVADSVNSRVRMIAGGRVSSVAGSEGYFVGATGLAPDGAGNMWVAEQGANRIRRIARDGTVLTAGGAVVPGGNDGLGTFARFRGPAGVAVAADGTVYVADQGNHAIRVGRSAALTEAATIDTKTARLGEERQLGSSGGAATQRIWQVVRRPAGSTADLSSTTSRTPSFTPDVDGAYLFRLTARDGQAESVTEVRFGSGTPFENMYVVPTDIASIDYPGYYQRMQQTTVYLENPYCRLTQEEVAYPASYLDPARLPAVTGAPLPAGIKRVVGLKDFWFGEAGYGATCGPPSPLTPTFREAYISALARIKSLGADYIVPMQTFLVSGTVDPVVQLPGHGIPEHDLAYITREARKVNLGVFLRMNGVTTDIPASLSRAWYSAFLDRYTEFIVAQAMLAEKYGVAAIELNWDTWTADLTPVIDLYNARLSQAAREIRRVYRGKLLLSEGNFCCSPGLPGLPEDVFNAVDMILVAPGPGGGPTFDKSWPVTIETLRSYFAADLNSKRQRYARFGKPLWVAMFLQSHPDFLFTGWIEEGFCLPGCPQFNVQTDLSSQAMAYEALFEAASVAHSSGAIPIGVIEASSSGYWFSDPLMPEVGAETMFPNLSQNIRNKPAESITYEWFKR